MGTILQSVCLYWPYMPCRLYKHPKRRTYFCSAVSAAVASHRCSLLLCLKKRRNQSRHSRPEMAADRTRTTLEENDEVHSSDLGCTIPKRHARVTVKYNRKELQKRLDVEKWIDESLDRLYSGQELLRKCRNNTETFIRELVTKLEGVHKQDELQSEGIEHPIICHSHYRHEPYHFNNPQPQNFHHARGQNQTL
ncbi:protein phosphatase 1, regulatory (inhibitor) subunit 14Aa isoform X2 [Micropterus salmoides]|uniref:protein phosphatase 1, regulatory (inhibitor) subunit 14Aa isoform X2 n=1 Tax=Micropterus salmoides TaxID=27706 RepID=UPI0018EB938D|nr:protein phosphatase 1, regulatory (inhibitor) subunit 14Aa isoform X2 [Micropterus salmoides]